MKTLYIGIILLLPLFLASCANTKINKMIYTPDKSYFYNKRDFLNYKVVGNGPITIVLIHGFGASLQTWNDILPYFDHSRFKLIMVDLKGSGFSNKPVDSNYSMDVQSKIVGDFLKDLNPTNYYLVGHSFGGGVVLLNTINLIDKKTYPLPNGLILIDAAVYKTELPFFVKYLRIPIVGNLLLSVLPAEYQAEYTLNKIYFDKSKVTPDLISRYSFFIKMDGYSEALIQTAKQIIPKDFRKYTERYKEISLKTLVLWGKQDPALPLSSGMKLVEELKSSKLVIIENCGHNPQEEQSQVVADLILNFIENIGD